MTVDTTDTVAIRTPGRGFTDVTAELNDAVRKSGLSNGLCHVFLRHTSASLLITENADPDVRVDLENFMARLVPDGDPAYVHSMEGPDDMPAHIRSVLTASELTIPLRNGRLALGTDMSELGRFMVTKNRSDSGAFRTSLLPTED